MLDIAIIGAGPAGLSAAINAVTLNKAVTVFGNKPSTSWLYKAEKVNNHLGMFNRSGKEMIETFVKHANEMDVPIVEGKVIQIMPMGDYFMLNVENEFQEAKTVIIATGIPKVKMLKNEETLVGKGVSYCATCDGMLYKNQPVVVYGEDEKAEEDVEYLTGICSKVYYLPKKKTTNITQKDNLEIIEGKPQEVVGNEIAEGLKLKDDQIVKGNAVFLLREATPVNQLLDGIELEKKNIKVNRNMATNIPGVFAAGDCTGSPYQLSKAIGEGLVAAQLAVTYLFNKSKEKAVH